MSIVYKCAIKTFSTTIIGHLRQTFPGLSCACVMTCGPMKSQL